MTASGEQRTGSHRGRLSRPDGEVDDVRDAPGNLDLFGPHRPEPGIPQGFLEIRRRAGRTTRRALRRGSTPLRSRRVRPGRIEAVVVLGDGPAGAVVDVEAERVVVADGLMDVCHEVGFDDPVRGSASASRGERGERSVAVPVDDRGLAFDDRDPAPARVGRRVREREPDAEPADQQSRARAGAVAAEGVAARRRPAGARSGRRRCPSGSTRWR